MAVNFDTEKAMPLEEARVASRGRSHLADIVIGVILAIVSLLVVFPFYDVLIVSFGNLPGVLLPTQFNLDAYSYIITHSGLIRAFLTSVGVVLVGTTISLALTTVTAYVVSRRYLPGRGIILGLVVFTMFFGGGLIPYYLVVKSLGMINSYWALILPSAMNAFFMIIMLSFFREFPVSLEESARIDGASDLTILLRVVLPTSGPVMATIGLFYTVDRWNDWFTPMLFLTDPAKWPLQTFTQQLIINAAAILQNTVGAAGASSVIAGKLSMMTDSLKMAVIVIGIIPIMCVYPLVQKHFTKGVMIGSIKG